MTELNEEEWEFAGNLGRDLIVRAMEAWKQQGIADQMTIGEPRASGGMSEDQLWESFVGMYKKKEPAASGPQ